VGNQIIITERFDNFKTSMPSFSWDLILSFTHDQHLGCTPSEKQKAATWGSQLGSSGQNLYLLTTKEWCITEKLFVCACLTVLFAGCWQEDFL
jgi:hypothetical protein